ncbi:MAG: response regulator [Acidobacteria bacterium]|nr:response regulator [Acidobacteriota bacterium]
MNRSARILVVDDDPDLAAGIRDNLLAEGHRVRVAERGDDGLALALDIDFDLILLDVMLPGMDGFEVCRALRDRSREVPVLFLTARNDPQDRVRGLAEGGDDYLSKPFDLAEMLARVAAILRRARWYSRGAETRVTFGGNEVDLRRYRAVDRVGETHELTHREAQILKFLIERENDVVTRAEILDRVWGAAAFPSARTIDNFILRLRRRFEIDPANPQHFHTVHGAGYRFTKQPAN